ncbi:hypothetical protein ACHAC9_02840 [Massilia sp. CMS3.1]|uniref:hypothetical protein n=1 Tax=Massilia sp. CMS3.1 TaxID=3373083 RepID=UPI003EE4EDF0
MQASISFRLRARMPCLTRAVFLEAGGIDLAIGYLPDREARNFFQQRLFTHSFISLLNAKHPVRGKRISMGDFLRIGHAVIRAERRSQEVFEQLLAKQRIERRILLSAPHFISIPFIITSTDLVLTVPYAIGKPFAKIANIRPTWPSVNRP